MPAPDLSRHHDDPESRRLAEDGRREKNWKRWGPYLAERQWGTVREDYSPDGDAWNYLTHDHSRSRAYRWGEDGLLGICDRECRLCFALALWNGVDPILKERLFGLSGPEGNHGEDVKEEYYYLDSTPTHSYMRGLYKYPQAEFPYSQLVDENARRGKTDPEFELVDTGVFADNRYFDVEAEYAKAAPDDILIRVTVHNRGADAARLHLLPTLWFRNSWTWGCTHEGCEVKPSMERVGENRILADHVTLGRFVFDAEPFDGAPADWLFTENESNRERLFDAENYYSYVKDSFHEYVVLGRAEAVNPAEVGTKAAAHYGMEIAGGASVKLRFRLRPETSAAAAVRSVAASRGDVDAGDSDSHPGVTRVNGDGIEDGDGRPVAPTSPEPAPAPPDAFGPDFDRVFRLRKAEADRFYDHHISPALPTEQRRVARQAYAGLLWSKQFYHYVVDTWLDGDPTQPLPPKSRKRGRNSDWRHLFTRDVLSVPDKWEYPWFAAWDTAFHMIPMAHVDPKFAKDQLVLLLREWYMHPNGQIPAYEYAFSDVNPPVHAWACWRVYKVTGRRGQRDTKFLASAFQKLLLNFTWWVNRKDADGRHIFAGGFLGLDNIGLFDRSRPLPGGARLDQADGTAWMAFFCATMLSMALELAVEDPVYEDVASKFFEHFVAIIDAINTLGGTGLWDEEAGCYCDWLSVDGEQSIPLRVRSMVGLIPLFACEVLEDETVEKLPGFKKRMLWFLEHRTDLSRHVSYCEHGKGRRLLAIPSREKLLRVLRRALDETEFLSPYGVRSLSKAHLKNPVVFKVEGREFRAKYTPGDSETNVFGGNSNWRGPVWFPLNYLLIEALERYHHFYGDELKIECPSGSGQMMNLLEVARELSNRLIRLFLPDATGQRPCNGADRRYADDPHFRDLALFHEFFHGDTGRGCGASHQTGWTSLVTRLLQKHAGHTEAAADEHAADEVREKMTTGTSLRR
jgi:hypothetical protein